MLKQQLQGDVKEALKQGNHEVVGVLRMTLSAANAKEKEIRYRLAKEKPELPEEELAKQSELSDDQLVDVLMSEIKKRKDAIALYQQGNRQELADKEMAEITILQKYLPEQLSLEDLQKLITESITATGASTIKDMGKVMADLAPKVKGKADNGQISKIVKELLK